jgi:3-oxoacyl-(acyl-carrier-protein) synthase
MTITLHGKRGLILGVENAGLDSVMTNSFGFGGTNGSMLLSRYSG